MLRDALWSPAWSHAHIAGAAEAIAGVIALRRNVIKLNPQHVLYIESRGKRGSVHLTQWAPDLLSLLEEKMLIFRDLFGFCF